MRVIAGTARSLKLITPKGMDVRPTTDRIKETLFNILTPYIAGCRFLDLFCGSGAIGIEALSRGAVSCTFVDMSGISCDCTKKNLEHTKLVDNASIIHMDVLSAVNKLSGSGQVFDIIFMDPPYERKFEKSVVELPSCYDILDNDGMIIIEASSDTGFEYIADSRFEIVREKSYGSNKHIFLKKRNNDV